MFESTWTTPSAPPPPHMYHTTPQSWSYMDSVATLDSSPYARQPPVYQNPYATQWSAPHPGYATQAGVPSAMYPPSQTQYRAQMVSAHPVSQIPYQPEHGPTTYETRMVEVSPTTTSTSISSTVASWPAIVLPGPTSELPHVCAVRGCGRAYKRKAELDRHQQEKHGPTSGRLLCPIKMCPRGISGEGFDRMSHLTQHLRSGKHKLPSQQAKFLAREHNPRKGGRNS